MKIKLFTLPNILTLMNLLCGSLAIIGMITLPVAEALQAAFLLMLASAVFDFADGMAARLLKQQSKLGVQLDSLADMVSFGLLPAVIALQIFYMYGGYGWWGAITLVIAAASALRLAKFNIDETQAKEFEGLPTPANALLIGAAGWYAALLRPVEVPEWTPWIILGCCVLLAYLMISPVRMFSLKFEGFAFDRNAVRYIYLFVSLLFVILFGLTGIGLAVILYILASVIMWIACPSKRRAGKQSPTN